jgi:hypothetical protein
MAGKGSTSMYMWRELGTVMMSMHDVTMCMHGGWSPLIGRREEVVFTFLRQAARTNHPFEPGSTSFFTSAH